MIVNSKQKNSKDSKLIITEQGLFYSNFSSRIDSALYFLEGSGKYSQKFANIRNNYGIKVGPPQPDSTGKLHEGSVGIYIVNYQKYLEDQKEKSKLHLVIGEPIPSDIPSQYSDIVLYVRENDNLKPYAEINLPYIINYSEFDNSNEEDPRYYFEEGHTPDGKMCRYRCVLIPFGSTMGVYRLGLDYPIKICSIELLEENKHTFIKK